MLPAAMIMGTVSTVLAAPSFVIDDAGADDEPGQKDLNFLTVDNTPGPADTVVVTWGWDDTATTGNNTRDACTLFDTDSDGLANFSLCEIVTKTDAVSLKLYICTADSRADRCGGPTEDTTFTSTGTVSEPANSDPFGVLGSPYYNPNHLSGNACDDNPGCNTIDTVANVIVKLVDVGTPSSVVLLNVCSYPSREPNSDPSDCVIEAAAPALSIVKTSSTTTYDSVGDTITYSIVATNTGNVPLAAVTITDANAVLGTCSPANGSPLAIGGTMTCAATHTVTQADIDAGHYLNAACVDDGAGGAVQVCDDVDVPGDQNPALSIEKTSSTATYDSVGDTVTYEITATNSGNTTLASVTITDANAVLGTCTPANGSELAPGASIVCAATHTITQADIDAGHYLNTACVDDGVGAGGAAEICDDVDVPGDQNPALSIEKTSSTATYDSVGDVITYEITATNSGNTTLASVTITDANAILGTCTPANGSELAPGASIVCAATHTITQADIDAGHYLNTACVDDGVGAGGAAEICDDVDVPGDQNPALSIEKTSSTATYDSVGDTVTYEITATNSGNTTLASVTITDANAVLGTCTPANGSELAPGASIVCAATHTITQADIDAGHYLNTACVDDGVGAGGAAEICDDVDVPGDQNPALSIEKTSSTATYDSVGDTVTYEITATNSGNTTLASVTITDANAVLGTCTPANGSELAPGASIVCAATHTITQADIDAGHYLNTACVDDGVGAGGAAEICDDVDVPGDLGPALSIEKTSSTATYDSVGDTVTYEITATNSGNTTLASVTITDANAVLGTCTPANGSELVPGASIVCAATHTITQADIDAGHYLNTACVDDGVGAGGAAEICDDVDVPGDQNPSLTIDKTSTTTSITAAGQVVPYSYLITNNGNVTLTGVTLTDDKVPASDITCNPAQPAELAPTATMTCTGSHTVTAEEFAAGGNLVNIAVADSDQTDPGEDDTVSIPIQPPPDEGRLMHTGTTCQQYTGTQPPSGLAGTDINEVLYSVKGTKISQAAPGVFFYFTTFSAAASSFDVTIDQSIDSGNFSTFFGVHQAQVNIFNANCTSFGGASVTSAADGDVLVHFGSATVGNEYIIQVKYTTKSVVGATAPTPTEVHYDFETEIGGIVVDQDLEGLFLRKK